MVQYVAVGATENINIIKEKLKKEFKILEGEGIKVRLEENSTGKLTFLFCWLTDFTLCPYKKEDIPVIFRQYIAYALADLILGQWEELLLKQILRENYYYFKSEEQSIIYNLTLQRINRGKNPYTESLGKFNRKSKILKKLLEFLRNHNQIVIEGFIRFRLKDYLRELEEAVDKVVDEFLMEKEYNEFIELLQYFIEIQKPRISLIHIVLCPGGIFRLYNEQKQFIRSDSLEDIFGNLIQCEINYEDLLFSILVSLAPQKIIFHAAECTNMKVLLKTIKKVFNERVFECPGCDLCQE